MAQTAWGKRVVHMKCASSRVWARRKPRKQCSTCRMRTWGHAHQRVLVRHFYSSIEILLRFDAQQGEGEEEGGTRARGGAP